MQLFIEANYVDIERRILREQIADADSLYLAKTIHVFWLSFPFFASDCDDNALKYKGSFHAEQWQRQIKKSDIFRPTRCKSIPHDFIRGI